jgi:hypothetical protein
MMGRLTTAYWSSIPSLLRKACSHQPDSAVLTFRVLEPAGGLGETPIRNALSEQTDRLRRREQRN